MELSELLLKLDVIWLKRLLIDERAEKRDELEQKLSSRDRRDTV